MAPCREFEPLRLGGDMGKVLVTLPPQLMVVGTKGKTYTLKLLDDGLAFRRLHGSHRSTSRGVPAMAPCLFAGYPI